MPELEFARIFRAPRGAEIVKVSSARAASTWSKVMCICAQLSIGPSLWIETFIPRCRSPASAGDAATPSASTTGTNPLVIIPSFANSLRPRSLLQELHQVIGGFLVAAHDR